MSKKTLGVGLLSVAILLTGAVGAAGAGASGAAPSASASRALTACNISGKEKSLGASYVTSVKVEGVSCAKGIKLVKLYHQCRKDKGGVCGSPGLGFSCKEGKRQEVPGVQYSTTMKCRKGGSKRVKSSYTQNI